MNENVLIVIPAYNEAQHLADMLAGVKASCPYDLVVVNDGSSDQTETIARAAGVRVLNHKINLGAGAATKTGLLYAYKKKYKYAITLDADGQHAAEDAQRLLEEISKGDADIVIGSRFLNKTNEIPASRRFFNGIANLFTALLAWRWYTDTQSGIKIMKTSVAKQLDFRIPAFGFCSEILIKASRHNLNVSEIPVEVYYTESTMKKGQNMFEGFRTVFHLLQDFISHS